MKKQFFYFVTIVAFALTGCGGCSDFSAMFEGKPVTKDFEVDGAYTSLEVSHAFDVTVSDAVDKVQVTAGEKIMPNVQVEMVGNTLRIYLEPQKPTFSSSMKVLLPYNAALTDIDFSGASDFHSKFGLEGTKVTVSLSGASDLRYTGDATTSDCSTSGGSSIKHDRL